MYQENNIFQKIIANQISCEKICENEFAISFYDISPKYTTHVLVIPKGKYSNIIDFHTNASCEEIKGLFIVFENTIEKLALSNGFKTVANTGKDGNQEVPHFHFHILGGKKLEKNSDI